MNHWFTSDWHLFHETILLGLRGGIFSSVEHMNETIIENIFSTVKRGDNLYVLGDLFWKYDNTFIEDLLDRFRKSSINLFIVLGNHDKRQYRKGAVYYEGFKDIKIQSKSITLCHFPLAVYNKSHYDAINLHGHVHVGDATYRKLNTDGIEYNFNLFGGKHINVNVEFWEYKPINAETIFAIADKCDHNFDYIERTTNEISGI